ncbi:hypothetical protein B9Z19DRAFT_1061643 [Tuber borchii]|uniref:Uncharacterized protein n=1 Tax=Tuber borchii TaxID=42251 RepID=A0A2T7A4D7_TUBBO|nr:hypothetical protein B9Z19DRAFT_1061643 [Tuber borchii]
MSTSESAVSPSSQFLVSESTIPAASSTHIPDIPGRTWEATTSLSPVSSQDHTQTMDFVEYVEWHEGMGGGRNRSPNTPPLIRLSPIPSQNQNDFYSDSDSDSASTYQESVSTTLAVSFQAQTIEPLDSDLSDSHANTPENHPTLPNQDQQSLVINNLLFHEAKTVVRTLWGYTNWSLRKIQRELNIPLSTVHRIGHQERTSSKNFPYPGRGRPCAINVAVKQLLMETATVNGHNRRLALSQVT